MQFLTDNERMQSRAIVVGDSEREESVLFLAVVQRPNACQRATHTKWILFEARDLGTAGRLYNNYMLTASL